MVKVVYIIPGFTEYTKQPEYKKIGRFFKAKSFKVVYADITWNYRVMSDYVKEFTTKYKFNPNDDNYFLGFSFGAVISFVASAKLKPKMQILCSLSGVFKEDMEKASPEFTKLAYKYCRKRRMKDLEKFSFNKTYPAVKSKSIILLGDSEHKEMFRRCKDANKKLKGSKLIIVPNNDHNIRKKEYLDAIEEVVSKIY
jgi:hypothetical protein